MNWYSKESMVKTAAYSAYIKGYDKPTRWSNLDSISDNLNNLLLEELNKHNIKIENSVNEGHGYPSFMPDGNQNTSNPKGIINFYTRGLPAKYYMWVLSLVKQTLTKNNIEISNISQEGYDLSGYQSPDAIDIKEELSGKIRVVRFVISRNKSKTVDIPTEIHWTGTTIYQVLKIIDLSYTGTENEEYDASDILSRGVQLAEESRLKDIVLEDIIAKKLNLSDIAYAERVLEKLQNLINLAAWAISHDYKKIYFV